MPSKIQNWICRFAWVSWVSVLFGLVAHYGLDLLVPLHEVSTVEVPFSSVALQEEVETLRSNQLELLDVIADLDEDHPCLDEF